MIIHHLKASGFRIIGEPINITFPTEGKIGILGQNESGKTTLFQAIECALYGLRKGSGPEADRENLVTWGKNEAKLEIEFTSGQNRYSLQRTFNPKNIHKANLTQVINGIRDKPSAITGLKDVEERIEQITGMDRDSFTKLVYIKQKDLDALKEMYKAKREQLVNKVMGIDLFDEAAKKVKEDSSLLGDGLKTMAIELEMVGKSKEEYETKLDEKAKLEANVEEQQPKLEATKSELENAKALLAKYEWISAHDSAEEVAKSLEEQLKQVEEELKKASELEKQSEELKKALENCKPQVTSLNDYIRQLSDAERRLAEAEADRQALQTKKQDTINKLGLPEKDLRLLSQNLTALKNKQLGLFLAMLLGGLACLALAFFTTIFLAAGAALLIGLSGYSFYRYLKIDKLATQNLDIEATNRQLIEQESKVATLQGEKANLEAQSAYKTSQDAQNQLNTILTGVKTETGEDTIEGAEALLRNVNMELSKIKQSNPQNKKTALKDQIRTKHAEIQELEKTKPASADKIKYSKEKHESLKIQRESIQTEWNNIKQSIDNDKGTIKQLEKDLKRLKADFELHPQLEERVQLHKDKIELLKMVNVQLSETSKGLRNKVLPHARLIINEHLPTLTGDRYSDFEITEDLKFKVYTREGGGYKEREIFSGGTQDQFLIALRLAFTQSILDSRVMADKYSLLMDECTSSSDEIRKQGIFEVLTAMKQTFSQIFIIAHEDIANYVDNHLILERNNKGYAEIKSKSWTQ